MLVSKVFSVPRMREQSLSYPNKNSTVILWYEIGREIIFKPLGKHFFNYFLDSLIVLKMGYKIIIILKLDH